MLVWMGIEWWRRSRPSSVGIATVPSLGWRRSPRRPVTCRLGGHHHRWRCRAHLLRAVHLKDIFHYDDSLDVVGVHMVAARSGPADRRLRQPRRERRRRGRRLDPARPPGSAGRRRNRLPLRHDLDHPVGHRPHRRAAGESEEEAAGLDLSEHAETGYEWPAASIDMTGDGIAASPGAPARTDGG